MGKGEGKGGREGVLGDSIYILDKVLGYLVYITYISFCPGIWYGTCSNSGGREGGELVGWLVGKEGNWGWRGIIIA